MLSATAINDASITLDILTKLQLRRPIYQKTAAYGHFGRDDPDFTWEHLDKVDVLKKEANN